jgi:hypothetical protein
MLRRAFLLTVAISYLIGLVSLVGCGGGNKNTEVPTETPSTRSEGSVSFVITWPTQSRLIPVAANSIKIAFSGGPTPTEKIVVRPATGTNTTDVTFPNLVVGTYTITATAYPSTNATGVAQAMGTGSVTVVKDQTVETGVTMATTISQIDASPAAPSVVVPATVNLTGSATDTNNAIVITANNKWTWSSSNTGVATVPASGNPVTVTSVSAGTTTITGTETESGKTKSVTVTVLPNTGDLDLTIK